MIPKWLCHYMEWHRWYFLSRNHSDVSARCSRCQMNGVEFRKREKKEKQKGYSKSIDS